MSIVLIVVILVIAVVIVASLALGRRTQEVDSARDTEYLELEGTWVRYGVTGGGPPVVLVHGWLSSSAVWDQLAGRLAQRFTVYTLDLSGFGESDKPLSGYGVRYGSRLLYAFCAHFGLARAAVIGHDIGGDMAVKLASDHPDVVGRVVLVATPANEEQIDLPTPLWAATLPVIGPIFYALGQYARPVRSMWMRPFVSEPADVTEEMLEDAANSTPAAMSQSLSVAKREISGGRLARQARVIKAPVLIAAGEEDQIVDPQAAGVWARSLDQSEVCLMDECGHMPMIERPGEFNAQVLAFLTGDARYLEQVERAADQTVDRTTDYPEDLGAETREEELVDERDDTRGFPTVPADDEEPAFGGSAGPLHDGELEREDGTTRRPRRESHSPSDTYREDPRDAGESRESEGQEDPEDDAPRPIIRRLGDRLSGSSSGERSEGRDSKREAEPREPRENETEETSTGGLNLPEDAPVEAEAGEAEAGETEAGEAERIPPPRRRRPRRESKGEEEAPELPGDLFDWGSTLDDFEPPPRRRRPDDDRRDEREGPRTDEEPDSPDDSGGPSEDEQPPRP